MANKIVDKYLIKCEQEVLSCIFNNPIVVEEAAISLDISDFIDERHAKLFGAIVEIHLGHLKQLSKNVVIDYITNNPKWQFDNWQAYLEEVASSFSYEEDLKANIELIKNASIKRQLDIFANEVVNTKIDYAKYDNQIFELEKKFLDITQSKHVNAMANMEQVANEFLLKINRLRQQKKDVTGTPIGYSSIDKTTNGFQPGDLIILAARPGVGKTAISLNFALNAAKKIKADGKADKEKVVIFSLEMGKEQLCQRLVSIISRVDSAALRSGKMNDAEWANVQSAIEEVKQLPILIDDFSDISIVDIQSKLKQLKNQYTIKLVVVDYIQLMKGPRVKGAQVNRQQEVSTISRMLKLLARRIEAPILALAQLSRDVEKRNDKTPILSDLRESGALEQDADLVCFLHGLPVVAMDDDDNPIKAAGPKERPSQLRIDFIIAKHRNGELKTIPFSMLTKYGIFHETLVGKEDK